VNQSTIIIAGMHRSGTSLSGNLLEQSGLFLGEHLLSDGFDNKNGHFEDEEILEIHEKDLRLKQFDTRGLKLHIRANLTFETVTNQAIDQFLLKRRDKLLWGWKEPRTTLYLQQWKLKLPNSKCIAIYRDYDEVADSLIRRYNYKLKHGAGMGVAVRLKHALFYPINLFVKKREAYKAWCIYNENILAFKNEYPDDVVIVELNHFLTHYNEIVTTVNRKFKIKLIKIKVDDIFEASLLSNTPKQRFKIRVFSKKKLNLVLHQLKHKALWI
jgi:hypothetical protein